MFLKITYRSNKKKDSIDKLSDEELLSQFRKKQDPEIVGILFNRYIHLVFGICLKYLQNKEKARDASMEIFENLFDDLLKYEIERFPPWIHTVSKNFCLMKQREKTRLLFEKAIDKKYEFDKIVESDIDLHHSIEREAELIEMEKALYQLKKEQEQCIRLFYLQRKSYQEVADRTGLSIKQVKSHIQNGKRNLKNIILNSRHKVRTARPVARKTYIEND